jgi:hypothetical protein
MAYEAARQVAVARLKAKGVQQPVEEQQQEEPVEQQDRRKR